MSEFDKVTCNFCHRDCTETGDEFCSEECLQLFLNPTQEEKDSYQMEYEPVFNEEVEVAPVGKLMNFRKPWRNKEKSGSGPSKGKNSAKRDKKNSRLLKKKMFENESPQTYIGGDED